MSILPPYHTLRQADTTLLPEGAIDCGGDGVDLYVFLLSWQVLRLWLTWGASLLALRRDARILKIPPYLSALCIIVGITWLLVLPLNEYSRGTYVSENALLPGQVHTYFTGSEHNVFRAYRHEVYGLIDKPEEEWVAWCGGAL